MAGDVALIVPYGWLSVSPSLQNECRVLADNGYAVDVFYFDDDDHDAWAPDHPNIETQILKNRSRNLGVLPDLIGSIEQLLRLKRRVSITDYDLAIGVDIMGLCYASILQWKASDPPPVVYHSLESMLVTDSLPKWLERRGSVSAEYGITMAESWVQGIAERTALSEDEIFVVPNSSIATDEGFDEDFLHEWLDIPADENIVVYGGSFVPNHLVAEIIDTVSDWKDDWNFVAHGWGPEKRIPGLKEKAGDLLDDQVFISNEVLPDKEYTSLIASADVGIALYGKGNEPKWRYGHPGKVYKYLETGTPIIASKTPSLEPLVAENDCGVCITSPDAIPDALEEIATNYDTYSQKCTETFPEYEFARNYEEVIEEFQNAGIL